MENRVYILLDVADGKVEQVVQVLSESPGVVVADAVEGPPDVVTVIQVAGREQLAKLTIGALASVETMTENVRLLPARDRLNTGAFAELSVPARRKNKSRGKRGGSKRVYRGSIVN